MDQVAPRRILVVDDDQDTRELYGLILGMDGFHVQEAGTIEEAVRAVREHRPSAVVCDWQLPDGDGFDLCRRLRALGPARPDTLVAVTGISMDADMRRQALQAGCYDVLEKPILPERITGIVQHAAEVGTARKLKAAALRVRRAAARVRIEAVRGSNGLADDALALVARADARTSSRLAIVVADDFARYVAASRSASELTGYSAQDLRSLSVWDLTPLPKTAKGRELWATFVAAGIQEGRYLLRRRDGTAVSAMYCAMANVMPGLHVSVMARLA